MKGRRFTEEQIIGVLKEVEAGAKVVDVYRKHSRPEVYHVPPRCITDLALTAREQLP